jgi:hypothetical protein
LLNHAATTTTACWANASRSTGAAAANYQRLHL